MELNQLEGLIELPTTTDDEPGKTEAISIETEIPEALYNGMKDFIGSNPNYDQYGFMSSALANFLYQNGCTDRAVTEKYLNDLFTVSQH